MAGLHLSHESAAPAGGAVVLAFASLALAGSGAPHAPQAGHVNFGGPTPADVYFERQAPLAGGDPADLHWPLRLAGTGDAYAPQSGLLRFGPAPDIGRRVDLAGTGDAHTPPTQLVRFGPPPGSDADLCFDLIEPLPGRGAGDLWWDFESSYDLAGTGDAYTPPTVRVAFGPLPDYFFADLAGADDPYQTGHKGVRFGTAPKPDGRPDHAGVSDAYFAPWDTVDVPRDSTARDLPPHVPPPGVIAVDALPWALAGAQDGDWSFPWGNLTPLDRDPLAAWADAVATDQAETLPWLSLTERDASAGTAWAETAHKLIPNVGMPWLYPPARDLDTLTLWQVADVVPAAAPEVGYLHPPAKDAQAATAFDNTDIAPATGRRGPTPYAPAPGDAADLQWLPPQSVDLAGTSAQHRPSPHTALLADSTPGATNPADLRWTTNEPPRHRPVPAHSGYTAPFNAPPPREQLRRLAWGPGKPAASEVRNPWANEPEPLPPDYPDILPTQEVYTVNNNLSVVRLPGREPIEALAVQLSLDQSSWAWSATIALAREADLALIDPAAGNVREVEINVNGFVIVVLAERYSRERVFGETRWVVRGRSRSALLADPYFPPRSLVSDSNSNSAQLANAEVFGTGWTVDWQLPVWNIDAGAFSYQDLSPMQALGKLAAAVGGVIRPDAAAKTLHIESRLPTNPADWGSMTPAAILLESVMTTCGENFEPTPEYNWIHCSGGHQGVNVAVTRSGTAGDKPAPDVVDPLITTLEAGQERARVELHGSGQRKAITYELPVLDPVGVVEPGRIVEVQGDTGWRGLVTSTALTAAWQPDAGLVVGQRLGLDRRDA